jgi:A/G-specific adenine glycosylase
VVTVYGGHLPETFDKLIKLPGIGRYTAGAIASIAFGQKVAAVDGNVVRAISRLVDYPEDVSIQKNKEYLWSLVGQIVPEDRPGDFNQALMELGQRICLVKRPHCHQCPLTELCLARIRGTQLERPVRPKRPRIPHYHVTAGVIKREDGRILITRRPLNGLLGGLWEFPGGKVEEGEKFSDALLREISEELAAEIFVGTELTTVQHAYTHFRITLHAFGATFAGGQIQYLGVINHAWVTLSEMDKYAFAATDLKIIAHLRTLEAQ